MCILPVVFLDVVQVIPADNSGPVHLQLGDDSGQDTATNGDLAGEGTLLVNVVTLTGLCKKFKVSKKFDFWFKSEINFGKT